MPSFRNNIFFAVQLNINRILGSYIAAYCISGGHKMCARRGTVKSIWRTTASAQLRAVAATGAPQNV